MKLGAALIVAALAMAGTSAPTLAQIRLDRPAGGGSAGGAPAAAPSGLVSDVSAEDIVRIMKDVGFKSTAIETNKAGAYVKARIDDTDTYIFLENCRDGRCITLLFTAYLGQQESVDEAFINDYNRNTIYTKLAKDKDGELQLMMPAGLYKGVSEDHVRSLGELWVTVFKESLDYKPSGK